jgi:hypothetical protein
VVNSGADKPNNYNYYASYGGGFVKRLIKNLNNVKVRRK